MSIEIWHAHSGISEPMPVAATFFTPDNMGRSLSAFANIDTMVSATHLHLYFDTQL